MINFMKVKPKTILTRAILKERRKRHKMRQIIMVKAGNLMKSNHIDRVLKASAPV